MEVRKKEWIAFFDTVFEKMKQIAFRQYPVEEDGSGSPTTLAIRKVFERLVCPLTIAEIKIDVNRFDHISDKICQVIRYDLSRIGEKSLNYLGVIDSGQKKKLRRALIENFNLGEKDFEEFYRDFRIIAWSEEELNLCQFKWYNVRNNMTKFAFELYMDILTLIGNILIERFSESKDHNVIFDLESDVVLPVEALTKKDRIVEMMKDITVEYLQEQVCRLQLVPSVSEHVKRVFERSKKLFVFGYFYYGFFTTSEHYAYLALESAIRNRYNQFLGDRAIVQSPTGETIELPPSWWRIRETCNNKRWKLGKIRVNGKNFLIIIDTSWIG